MAQNCKLVICIYPGHIDLTYNKKYIFVDKPRIGNVIHWDFIRIIDDSGDDVLYPTRWFKEDK